MAPVVVRDMTLEVLQKKYRRVGRWYDLLDSPWEMLRYRHIRPLIWRYVEHAGVILDAGIGTGRNIEYYPAAGRIIGLDLSDTMLKSAVQRSAAAERRIPLCAGSVTDLPFAAHSFDAVVSTFLFCVLPDDLQPVALKELARVLRKGGVAVFLEYQYSKNPIQRSVMKLMSPVVEWLYHARFDRRTSAHLRAAGWRITEEKFVSKDILKLIVASPPA